MEGGENHEPPRFGIEVNVPKGGQNLAVLRLNHGAALQGAAEASVNSVLINYLVTCEHTLPFKSLGSLRNVLVFHENRHEIFLQNE
jgi:hypothetical protein